MKTNQPSLMVILSHPDDESFSIGGTLAKYASAGVKVILICATRGELGIPNISPEETGKIREAELYAAVKVIGISDVIFLGYRDGDLISVNSDEIIFRLIEFLQAEQPQAVVTFGPDGISGHSDHIAMSQFVTQAVDQSEIKTRLYYIAPSDATLQGCGVPPPSEIVGGFVTGIDVENYLVTKVRAMQCHVSQHPPYLGVPEEEARRLACHEYFTLVRPLSSQYLRQLRTSGRLKYWVNSAQTGNLLKNVSQ